MLKRQSSAFRPTTLREKWIIQTGFQLQKKPIPSTYKRCGLFLGNCTDFSSLLRGRTILEFSCRNIISLPIQLRDFNDRQHVSVIPFSLTKHLNPSHNRVLTQKLWLQCSVNRHQTENWKYLSRLVNHSCNIGHTLEHLR